MIMMVLTRKKDGLGQAREARAEPKEYRRIVNCFGFSFYFITTHQLFAIPSVLYD